MPKEKTDWLATNNAEFVPKLANPRNVSQVRPIETFSALLSQLVYKDGWEDKSPQDLEKRIRQKI